MSVTKRLEALRNRTRKQIIVEAWSTEDEDFVLYSKELTCGDVDKIQKKHKDFINNPSISAMVDMILLKAEDESGDKLFTLEDRKFLMTERLDVISEIAGAMFEQTTSIEDAEKN